jgi:starch synthase
MRRRAASPCRLVRAEFALGDWICSRAATMIGTSGMALGRGIIVTHPTGNQNLRALLRALSEREILDAFFTTIAWSDKSLVAPFLPSRLRRQLGRRSYDEIPDGQVHSYPWREFLRLLAGARGLRALTRHEIGVASVDAVYRTFDRHVARWITRQPQAPAAIYAYEDGARESFRAARSRGIRTVYELPIAYWRYAREIFEEERELAPEWAMTLEGLVDSDRKLAMKDEELALADHVMVASSFVETSLKSYGHLSATVDVVPYGAPFTGKRSASPRTDTSHLRVLYVGSLGQRKGLSYLFDAMRLVGPSATLTLVGARPSADCAPLRAGLDRHDWKGSLPHNAVLDTMADHDVLVFPSILEGFGLVILEAMSQGLPVITTPNTAGPMLIEDGVDGFIVPIRDSEAIADRILRLFQDPALLRAMSVRAEEKAAIFSWSRYQELIASVLLRRLASAA